MTEEFKAILELVRSTGQGAFYLAVVYFVYMFFKSLVPLFILGFLGVLGFKIGKAAMAAYGFGADICKMFNKNIYYGRDRCEVRDKILNMLKE